MFEGNITVARRLGGVCAAWCSRCLLCLCPVFKKGKGRWGTFISASDEAHVLEGAVHNDISRSAAGVSAAKSEPYITLNITVKVTVKYIRYTHKSVGQCFIPQTRRKLS